MPIVSKIIALLLLVFFTHLFLSQSPVFASEYYLQDEFNETRPANTVDSSKWNIFPNTASNFATAQEASGNLALSQQALTSRFPLVVSKSTLPDGDFSAEIKFQYTNVTYWGIGIALSEQAPANGEGFNNILFTINVWQDRSANNMRFSVGGKDIKTIPINTDPHVLRVDREGKRYSVYVDDVAISTTNTSQKIQYIWMGNPTTQNPPIPAWTSFQVDYIRVKKLSPDPFLDLPFDYQTLGKSFEDVALNPNSWFDHQYPLQNLCCEPPVMNYLGNTINSYYRSHNGYDYSLKNGVKLNTPVLAAASGLATFKPWQKSYGAGNVIKIDHGNGYQTWYEHLSGDNLIVSEEGKSVPVTKGQQIGLVGMTGKTTGPHIHFSVFKDSNSNGSFNDEIPYGVTDPLGWEGVDPDPWPSWTNGTRFGVPSFNLFLERAPAKSASIPTTGGTLTTNQVKVEVPGAASTTPFSLTLKKGPFANISSSINSVVPSLILEAFNNAGEQIFEFAKPIQITYEYTSADLSNINEDTISLYRLDLLTNLWEKLPTTLDKIAKIATVETIKFSQFALMGEVKDTIAPETHVVTTGDKGKEGWYRSDVKIELLGQDNEGGSGLLYTLYSLNGNDWLEYTQPLIFNSEGAYKVKYQSFDKADNKEEQKTLKFHIDKTAPRVLVDANPKILWPANGDMVDVTITGNASDGHLLSTRMTVDDEYNRVEPKISDFGQTIKLEARRRGNDQDGRLYTINAVAEDLAGNKSASQSAVIVPHDLRVE